MLLRISDAAKISVAAKTSVAPVRDVAARHRHRKPTEADTTN